MADGRRGWLQRIARRTGGSSPSHRVGTVSSRSSVSPRTLTGRRTRCLRGGWFHRVCWVRPEVGDCHRRASGDAHGRDVRPWQYLPHILCADISLWDISIPLLTDVDFNMVKLAANLFGGLSKVIEVHDGFHDTHSRCVLVRAQAAPCCSCMFHGLRSAPNVLSAVKKAMQMYNCEHVTIVGHSLGAHSSLLVTLVVRSHFPPSRRSNCSIGRSLPPLAPPQDHDIQDGRPRHASCAPSAHPLHPSRLY